LWNCPARGREVIPLFTVKADFAPPYELVISLSTVLSTAAHRLLEIGRAWPARMRRRMSPELQQALKSVEAAGDRPEIVYLLIYLCTGDRSVHGFLSWLGSLSPGDIYELVAPLTPEGMTLSPDLHGFRDRVAKVMTLWDREYFSTIDPRILQTLEADARRLGDMARGGDPAAVVEAASGGVVVYPEAGLDAVLLIPQYHMRPWNGLCPFRNTLVIQYPAEMPPESPNCPSPTLLRFGQAMSDPSRLRILRHLAKEPRTFTEIVRFLRQPKSTVHYHLVTLRAAGLVRVHSRLYSVRSVAKARTGSLAPGERYSLREPALAEHWQLLRDYLMEERNDEE
jgi:DNA-binding transcriptional ArsR family regulator